MGKCAASQIIQAMKIDNNTFGYFLFYRYSCRIIWLEVSTTNNDPNVILLLYLLAVLNNNGIYMAYLKIIDNHDETFGFVVVIGCPSIVRTDRGTENTSLAASHMALRHNHLDEFRGEKSFRYGSSTTNTVKYLKIVFYDFYFNCTFAPSTL